MTEPGVPIPPRPTTPIEWIFPTLTPAQVARIAAHGSVRTIRRGEVLVEAGEHAVPFFVVTAGQVQIVRLSHTGETLLAVYGPGQFTGEANTLSGRPALARVRASEPGEVIALDAKRFIKTGPDLSQDDLAAAGWPLTRRPHLLETSRPGVFAVGDVRGGNVKRVATAVGEGSIAVAFVHQVLHE